MWRSQSKPNDKQKIQRFLSKNFSFKDVESLCSDENNTHNQRPDLNPNPHPTKSKNKPSLFHRVYRASAVLRALGAPALQPDPTAALPNNNNNAQEPPPNQYQPSISLPGTEDRIVVYLTSLRVVRSTFENCRTVRSILCGCRVHVDERDLSMDSLFMEELQRIFSTDEKTKLTLPRVFIGGKYIGGAEELRRLNETGELKKLVQGLPAPDPGGVCEECGGYRYILCVECNGSHKRFTEKKNGFRSCTVCNENGLIRCPSCSSDPILTV